MNHLSSNDFHLLSYQRRSPILGESTDRATRQGIRIRVVESTGSVSNAAIDDIINFEGLRVRVTDVS